MKKLLVIIVIIAFGLVLFSFTSPAERYFEIAKNLEIFATLFKEVNSLYVDDVNPNKMVRTGIDAMLNSLDPYTNYISEDEVEDYRTSHTGQYGGIGALTRPFKNHIFVTMVFENYPAYKMGLKIGDEIIRINNIELSKLTGEEANHLMKGQVGKPINLTVKRYGESKYLDLEFKREKIKINNVPYFGMLSPHNIGYVQLTEFTQDCGKEVRKAITMLKEKGAQKIILDLRGNPGGLLLEAVDICNLFIPKGKKVVATRGKSEEIIYETSGQPLDTEIPLAILINRGSASASEIVAGTLQDYDRAVILGEKSYGKGLVQISKPLAYNSQVKITTAKYYTPTNRCIQVLDYSHRREDGSVISIPDSLKKAFTTAHGRIVYDGGGIDPDIIVDIPDPASVTQALFANGYIFEFGTMYAYKHPSIADARSFSLTAAEYQEFVKWMEGKDVHYHSQVEYELNAFVEEAKKEKYYTLLKPQLDQIMAKINDIHKDDLVLFKDQIKKLLVEEIAGRYYYEKGSVEAGLKFDDRLKKAIDILNQQEEYKKILHQP